MQLREQSRCCACKARKSTVPRQGKRCGRREREADHGHSRSNPRALAHRGGGRRPARRKPSPFAGRRQMASLGRSDFVRRVLQPCGRSRRRQWVAPRSAEKGNAVGMRLRSACTRRQKAEKASVARGHVLCSVLGPVHVDRHSTLAARADGGDASHAGIAVGQISREGEGTGTGAGGGGRCAARRASPLPKKEQRDASEKEGGRGHRPCEVTRVLVEVPARRG
jgi:hypothetical protein